MQGTPGTPLVKKLGVKEGCAVHTVGAPPEYRNLLKPLPAAFDRGSRDCLDGYRSRV